MTTFTRLVDWSVASDGTLKRWQRVPSVVPTAPGVPTNVAVAVASSGTSATVSWAAPTSNGGSAITGYTVKRVGGTTQTPGATTFTATFTGLTAGQPYQFSVAAVNAIGTGPAAIATTTRFPGDTQPKQTGHLYMGASPKFGGPPDPWESAAGVKFGIRHRYDGGSPDAGPLAVPNGTFAKWITEDHAAGRLPLLGWHLANGQWAAAAGGAYDSQINAFMAYVEGLSKPVYLIVDHEPEDGNSTDYKAWMNHFRALINAYKSAHPGSMKRFVFGGCFQAATMAGAAGGMAQWWPGDGVYDVLGIDGYAWTDSTAMPSANMVSAMKYCAAHNQPFGWSEYGVHPNDPTGGAKIRNLYSQMTSGGFDCIYLSYFQVDGSSWTLNTDNGTYQEFISELRDSRSIHMSDLGY